MWQIVKAVDFPFNSGISVPVATYASSLAISLEGLWLEMNHACFLENIQAKRNNLYFHSCSKGSYNFITLIACIDRNTRINYIYKREFHSKIKKVDRKTRGKTVKGMYKPRIACVIKTIKGYSCSECRRGW